MCPAPSLEPKGAPPPREPVTVASTNGVEVRVHTLVAPTPGAPVVLAAHATGFHGRVFTPLAERLGELTGARVVAPDLRGHGLTPLPAGVDLDWDGFADDVLAVVDALGLEAPVGVGHSKGGAALLRAEARRPGTFGALWCYEPVVFPPGLAGATRGDNPLAAGALRRRDEFPSLAAATANFAGKPPMSSFDPRVVTAYVEGGFAPVDPGDPDAGVRLRCRPEVEAETYRMGAAHNTFAQLGEVACPTVVARGVDVPVGPAHFAAGVANAIPAGQLVTYDDLGHFGPLEDPGRIAADIARFARDHGKLREV